VRVPKLVRRAGSVLLHVQRKRVDVLRRCALRRERLLAAAALGACGSRARPRLEACGRRKAGLLGSIRARSTSGSAWLLQQLLQQGLRL
jgi:hypothetical protein